MIAVLMSNGRDTPAAKRSFQLLLYPLAPPTGPSLTSQRAPRHYRRQKNLACHPLSPSEIKNRVEKKEEKKRRAREIKRRCFAFIQARLLFLFVFNMPGLPPPGCIRSVGFVFVYLGTLGLGGKGKEDRDGGFCLCVRPE